MTTTITIETLQNTNHALRQELTRAQTELHYTYVDRGSIYHRGPFANCPNPECVRVRAMVAEVQS